MLFNAKGRNVFGRNTNPYQAISPKQAFVAASPSTAKDKYGCFWWKGKKYCPPTAVTSAGGGGNTPFLPSMMKKVAGASSRRRRRSI